VRECLKQGREVVFWGRMPGEVTIRDNAGVLNGGRTGVDAPDGTATTRSRVG
jgi:hypothetical protein